MIPWECLAAAPVPGGAQPLRLMRRGSEIAIWLGSLELMNARRGGSEEALAHIACERLGAQVRPHLLIGGLGLGFTFRAALAHLGPEASVTVSELVPAVVAWARGPLAELFAGSLDDTRVTIVGGDVGALIRGGAGAYDAILLDVDNGPGGLARAGNDGLYGARGLAAAHGALRHGGLLAVWSEAPDAGFSERMRRAGFALEEVRARAHGGRGARHIVWIGRRA